MPQEPKKRHSRQRQGKRRASINFEFAEGILCSNCGAKTLPHIICKQCGYYKGVEKIVPKDKKKEEQKKLHENPPRPAA